MDTRNQQPRDPLDYENLEKWANIIYTFISGRSDYPHQLYFTESGEVLSMAEAHMLDSIDDLPGITIKNLAKIWKRTGSAVSQTATKLEKRGYLIRKKLSGDDRSVHLYITPAGHAISEKHKSYSAESIQANMERLMETFTPQEIECFFRVMDAMNQQQ